MKLKIIILCSTILAGCAITNETALVTGTPRAAIAPEQVKLYTKAPAKYEEIAIVSADAAHDFMSKQALQDKALAGLKNEAAKVGANGVLLTSMGDTNLGSVGTVVAQPLGKRGAIVTGGAANRSGKAMQARAIFVIEE